MATITTVTSDLLWAQNRICNRYRPLVADPTMAQFNNPREVDVIVMDSGIDRNHPEFDGVAINDLYSVPGFGGTFDDLGHGTQQASLLVGKTIGLCQQANLHVVKIKGANYQLTAKDLGMALDAIYEFHLSRPTIPKIVNMSWSIPRDAVLETKLRALLDAGVLLIASAGNDALDIDTILPAGLQGVFTVAASTVSDEELVGVYGTMKKIDIYAPGEDVLVAEASSQGFKLDTGASPATALVSGVAALTVGLFEQVPSSDELKLALRKDATPSALLVGDKVSNSENRLLHRPDASSTPVSQGYYGGNIMVGDASELTIPLNQIMPLQSLANTYGDISYAVNWTTTEGAQLFSTLISIGSMGGVSIASPESMNFGGEVLRQFSFTVTATLAGMSVDSPMIHFFVTEADATGQDLAASVEALNAQSYLIPLTLSQVALFK